MAWESLGFQTSCLVPASSWTVQSNQRTRILSMSKRSYCSSEAEIFIGIKVCLFLIFKCWEIYLVILLFLGELHYIYCSNCLKENYCFSMHLECNVHRHNIVH